MANEYVLSAEEVKAIWQQMCAELSVQLSPAVFNTWIMSNPLTSLVVHDEQAVATFTGPTAFHANHLKKNLSSLLKQSLDKVVGKDTLIEVMVGNPMISRQNPSPAAAATAPSVVEAETPSPAQSVPTATHLGSPSTATQVSGDIADAAFRHQPTASAAPNPTAMQPHYPPMGSQRVEDLFSPTMMSSATVDRASVTAKSIGLRPDYTFEAFAVSTTNEMAHAAATAVSNRPGTAYNPLFLYGGVGVGKTHLMHAIGINMLKHNPDTRIIYCTGEEFTNEIVNAIQTKKAIKFKERFRNANVLLIDDVQFIAGKNAVQEEFFHTFNALISQSSQIVMTSDRPPHEINLLEDRLRSRFEAGLMIDIQQPTFELRTAILLIKSAALNLEIPMDVAQLIASKVDSARKIEGIITSLRSAVELKRVPVTTQLVEEILKTEVDRKKTPLRVSPIDIMRTVSNHYHIKQAALRGQQRVAQLVKARHVAMYLFKEELNMPYTEIGKWFSGRDHTSAMHGCRRVEIMMKQDDLVQRDISALRMSLQAISR